MTDPLICSIDSAAIANNIPRAQHSVSYAAPGNVVQVLSDWSSAVQAWPQP